MRLIEPKYKVSGQVKQVRDWKKFPLHHGIDESVLLAAGRERYLRCAQTFNRIRSESRLFEKYCTATGERVEFRFTFKWFIEQMLSPYKDGFTVDYYGKGKDKICWCRPGDVGHYVDGYAYLGSFSDNARLCASRTIAVTKNSANTKGHKKTPEQMELRTANRRIKYNGSYHGKWLT